MTTNPTDSHDKSNAFSIEDKPVRIEWALCNLNSYGIEWHCGARTARGAEAGLTLSVGPGGHASVSPVSDRADRLIEKEAFDGARRARHCDLIRAFGGDLEFAPDLYLLWGTLDLDPDFVREGISRGANLSKPILEGSFVPDVLGAAVEAETRLVNRFFVGGERCHEWGEDSGCFPDLIERACEIRKLFREAGALDATSFREALRKGDFDHAYACLMRGVPVDAKSPEGLTPLIEALFRRDLQATGWLLQNGAGIREYAWALGFLNAWTHRKEVSGRLSGGAHDLSPLTAACLADFREGFSALMEFGGCGLDEKDFWNLINSCVPPAWAIKMMAKRGFSFRRPEGDDSCTDHSRGVFAWPGQAGSSASIRMLCELCGPDIFFEDTGLGLINPLVALCREPESGDRLEIARTLLEAGVSPNRQTTRRPRYQEMLERGDISKQDMEFWEKSLIVKKEASNDATPLHIAVASGNSRMEALLLEFGADPEAVDYLGRKPADLRKPARSIDRFLADTDGDMKTNPRIWAEVHARAELDRSGCDPAALVQLLRRWLGEAGGDPKPRALLREAARGNRPALVEVFLETAPDRTEMGFAMLDALQNAQGLTGHNAEFSIYSGDITDPGPSVEWFDTAKTIAELLRRAGAPDFTRLLAAARAGDIEGIRTEIAAGIPLNFQCDGWGTPLLAAIKSRHTGAVQTLIEAGADTGFAFDCQALHDDPREYPVDVAVEVGSLEILSLLLQAGAPVFKSDCSLFLQKIHDPEIARLLFEGREVFSEFKDPRGNTGVHLLDAESLVVCRPWIPQAVLDARNNRGVTPLLAAIGAGPAAKASALVAAGADPNHLSILPDSSVFDLEWYLQLAKCKHQIVFLTPVHAAILSANEALIGELLEAGGRLDLPAYAWKENESAEARERLLADLEGVPHCECSLFHPGGLDPHDASRFARFVLEEPTRADSYPEILLPLTCLELAVLCANPQVIETVAKATRK